MGTVVDFVQISPDPELLSDDRLRRLITDQRDLWSGGDAWAIFPTSTTSFEATGCSWEAVRQLVEALQAAVGPIDAVSIGDFSERNTTSGTVLTATFTPESSRLEKVIGCLQLLVHVRRGQPDPPKLEVDSLNSLIRDFFLSLSTSNRETAEHYLRLISSNGRLRQENFRFLQLQMLASFDEWSTIRRSEDFRDLTLMRTPTAIGSILLETIWICDVADKAEGASPSALIGYYRSSEIESRYGSLFEAIAFPSTFRSRRLLALHLASNGQSASLQALLARINDDEARQLQRILGLEGSTASDGIREVSGVPALMSLLFDGKYRSVVEIALANPMSPESVKCALEAAIFLDEPGTTQRILSWIDSGRVNVSEIDVLKSLVDRLRELLASTCSGWIDWSNRVITEALDHDRAIRFHESMDSWSIGWLDNHASVTLFSDNLLHAYSGPNSTYLSIWLGPLIKMLKANADGAHVHIIYEPLLLILEEVAITSKTARVLVLDAVETVVGDGCTEQAYRDCLNVLRGVWKSIKSPVQVHWIAEVLETLAYLPKVDISEYERFCIDVASDLAGMVNQIETSWYIVLRRILGDLLIARGTAVTSNGTDWSILTSCRLGIYSLLPEVTTIAHDLEKLAPGVVVVVDDSHVETASLRGMARGCDVIFLQISQAKHAATNSIKRLANCELRPVHGRSRSAVWRAIEEWVVSRSYS